MAETASDPLVSTSWLAEHLDAPDIRVVDATWYLPNAGRDPRAEYVAAHIPGAVFFDIDDISDETNPYPHMIPSATKFSARMRRLGLGDGARIIVYDNSPLRSAVRGGGEGSAATETVSATERVTVCVVAPPASEIVTSSSSTADTVPLSPGSRPISMR